MKRDLRSVLFLSIFLVLFGLPLAAQTSSVKVSTSPQGAQFIVDGIIYNSSQTFLWPTGSKHEIQFPQSYNQDGTPAGYQQSLDGSTRYSLASWILSNGQVPTTGTDLVFVADPTLTAVTISTAASYKVQLRFSSYPVLPPGDCSTGVTPLDAPREGLIILNGTCYGSDADIWLGAGSATALAYPFPGWVFGGWSSNGSAPIGYSGTVTINGPTALVPQFILAKRVSFRSNPAGMTLLIDHTPTPTLPGYGTPVGPRQCIDNLSLPPVPPISMPALCFGDFDFIPGSSHTIGANSPQYDLSGNMWILNNFDNGLLPNSVLVVPTDISTPEVITAQFVPGFQASFLTNPLGLKLNIDGRTNWITYNFAWGQGTSHTATATDQTDSNGRVWSFSNWSNGGTASQTFTINGAMRWTANFTAQPQVILQSVPSGLTVQVDGTNCVTPCTLNRASGSVANITAPATIPISDTSRMVFSNWSDGASTSRSVSFNVDQQILTLNYQTQFKLAAVGNPTQGANFTTVPASSDMFFPQGSGVTVVAQALPGFKFLRWDGDLSGTYNQGTLAMTAPHAVTAELNRVPYIAPAGIRNAAGVTPDGTVAPGSLVAITGQSLTAAYLSGRTTPLSQGIGDITVNLNGSLLPLVFIAPQEIRAQMSSGLPDGNYSLTVQSTTQAAVTGTFTVARNSPGLFPSWKQPDPAPDTPILWAIHADGTAITVDAPAISGESITIYGTGFGPVTGATFDAFPASADMPLQDQIQLQVGGSTLLTPDWAGLLGGQVGLMAVRTTITSDYPTATTVNIAVIVNGHTSNTVALPLQ